MWFFNCPNFYFGEDALSQLELLNGTRAFIVTDTQILQLGYVDAVRDALQTAVIETQIFAEVEPDPSLQTIHRGAQQMLAFEPDWVIGLGGGSAMDAAKAMWVLYERPDIVPESINPFDDYGLRQKAKLICIPTTAGTGSEANYAVVLTDPADRRKLTLGSREMTPDMAIVDPYFTKNLPQQITADTGIDVLSHAIEAYACTWANDFTDGQCLQAAKMVVNYLPRAVKHGAADEEAREKMANAAAIAGMTLGNSQVALAHALGHSLGAIFKEVPHGRITGLLLPYTIEFVGQASNGRYQDMARWLNLSTDNGTTAAINLAQAVRGLLREVGQPTSLQEADIEREAIAANMPIFVEHVEMDANTLMSRRIPDDDEIEKLIWYAYEGKQVDF